MTGIPGATFVPVPLIGAVVLAFPVMLNVPLTRPSATGENFTLIVQVEAGVIVPTQLSVSVNVALPDTDTAEIVRLAVPVFVNVTGELLFVPMGVPANSMDDGLSPIAGAVPPNSYAPTSQAPLDGRTLATLAGNTACTTPFIVCSVTA